MKQINYFIGSNNQTKIVDVEKATKVLDNWFEGYTTIPCAGVWEGGSELSMMVIVIVSDTKAQIAGAVADILCAELEQEMVGYTVADIADTNLA